MNVKLYRDELAEQHSSEPIGVISGINYLNVCAHCGECLKQLTMYPSKHNVVVVYRNDKGEYVKWNPEDYKQSLIKWLEEMTYGVRLELEPQIAIDKVIDHIKEQ